LNTFERRPPWTLNPSGATILDLGCGAGSDALIMASRTGWSLVHDEVLDCADLERFHEYFFRAWETIGAIASANAG